MTHTASGATGRRDVWCYRYRTTRTAHEHAAAEVSWERQMCRKNDFWERKTHEWRSAAPWPAGPRDARLAAQAYTCLRWRRSDQKCRFAAQSCCGTSQRC
eukprot:3948268-Prymnesium_polylepis.1